MVFEAKPWIQEEALVREKVSRRAFLRRASAKACETVLTASTLIIVPPLVRTADTIISTTTAIARAVPNIPEGVQRIREQLDQITIWNKADVSPQTFIRENEVLLSNIDFGCTFIPEEFGLSLQLTKQLREHGNKRNFREEHALTVLEGLANTVGMTHIRLAIRGCESVDENGDFDASMYEPILLKAQELGLRISLSLDLLKGPMYPEFWPPDSLKPELHKNVTITPDSEVGKQALKHYDQALAYVKATFGNYIQDFYVNEMLDYYSNNRDYPCKISPEYVREVRRKIAKSGINNPIFHINTSPENMIDGARYVAKWRQKDDVAIQDVVDLDYYPFRPKGFIGKESWQPSGFSSWNSNVLFALSTPLSQEDCDTVKQLADLNGFDTGIMELELHPWYESGHNLNQPGNDAALFQATLLEGSRILTRRKKGRSPVLLWGSKDLWEALVSDNPKPAHRDIRTVIQHDLAA